MRRSRKKQLRVKLAVLCMAGTLFQTVQCTQTTQDLATSLVQSIASTYITDYVNNLFNVQPFPF